MKHLLKNACMLAVSASVLLTPTLTLANDGGLTGDTSDNVGLVGNNAGLTGNTGLTGEPGLQSTTTDTGLLGNTNTENAFDTSISGTDANTTPISTPETSVEEPTFEIEEAPAFELTEAPAETQPVETKKEDKNSPILELEDDVVENMDELPKTGFASSAALVGAIGLGSAGMLGKVFKKKED